MMVIGSLGVVFAVLGGLILVIPARPGVQEKPKEAVVRYRSKVDENEAKRLRHEVDSLTTVARQMQAAYEASLTQQMLKLQGRIDERLEAIARLQADTTKGR